MAPTVSRLRRLRRLPSQFIGRVNMAASPGNESCVAWWEGKVGGGLAPAQVSGRCYMAGQPHALRGMGGQKSQHSACRSRR